MSNIEAKIKINRVIYPRNGQIKSGEWGIISCSPIEVIAGEPILDRWDCFTVKGILPDVNLSDTYKFIGKLVKDNTYGYQYEPIYFATEYDLENEDQQRTFLSHILTDNQMQALYNTFDNPFVVIEKEDIDSLKSVKGIGYITAEKIVQKYKDNIDYSAIFVELNDYGLSRSMTNKLMEVYRSPDIVIQKVKENPYILADEVDGIGWSKADAVALKAGFEKISEFRIMAFLKYWLEQEAQKGNAWVYPSDLLYAVEEMIKEEIDQEFFRNVIYKLYEDGILYWDESKSFISLKKYWELENNIKEELIRLLESDNTFEYDNYELRLSKAEEYQGWRYTSEQRNAIRTVLENNVCIITGFGGTGKTTVLKTITEILDNYSQAQCSLAGKAASRMQEVTGRQGHTIHKLLEYNPREGFVRNKGNPLLEDIIILDETSMIGAELFYQLVQAVKDGAKLIMVGDDGQLEAIGMANVFKDLLDCGRIPVARLTQIHRQAQKSAIITNSIDIRNGIQIVKNGWTGVEVRGELQDLVVDIYDDKILTAPKIVDWFKQELENGINIRDIQIITPVIDRGDACTFELNNSIQEFYNPYSPKKNEESITKFVKGKKKNYVLREGDKVINVKNNRKTTDANGDIIPIFNGYTGIIKHIFWDYMIIDFDMCGEIIVQKKYWNNIEIGYSITCHKGQGSQWDVIIIGVDYNSYSLLTKELIYTGITRASKKCILCAENSALRYATSNSNISTKQTFLAEMLRSA